jgi:hypothetical protein
LYLSDDSLPTTADCITSKFDFVAFVLVAFHCFFFLQTSHVPHPKKLLSFCSAFQGSPGFIWRSDAAQAGCRTAVEVKAGNIPHRNGRDGTCSPGQHIHIPMDRC